MGKEIKWGILGAGRIAGWFSTGLTVVPDAKRYAVASRTLEKGQKFAAEYGYEKAYGSYEELVSDDEVDVVYIATPVMEHYKNIMMCLEHGKHVLCEKSMTVNADQAREAAALAREKHLFLMEALWTKCHPVFREVTRWIREGVIGEIQGIDARFYTACGKGHRLYKKEIGGGALLDLGYYPVACSLAYFDQKPERIISHTIMGEKQVDYLDSIILEFAGGKFAHISTGLGSEKMVSLYILGSRGRISMQDEFFFQAQSARAVDFDNQVLAEIHEPFLKNGYEYEAMEVVSCLQKGQTESSLVKLEDTIASMEIIDTCRKRAGFAFDCEQG